MVHVPLCFQLKGKSQAPSQVPAAGCLLAEELISIQYYLPAWRSALDCHYNQLAMVVCFSCFNPSENYAEVPTCTDIWVHLGPRARHS